MTSSYSETDQAGLLEGARQSAGGRRDEYGTAPTTGQSASARLLQLAFASVVVVVVVITFILSIVRTVTEKGSGGLYIMLGMALLGLVAIALLLLYFIRNGELPEDKQWFLYFIGFCLVLESVFTNILLF